MASQSPRWYGTTCRWHIIPVKVGTFEILYFKIDILTVSISHVLTSNVFIPVINCEILQKKTFLHFVFHTFRVFKYFLKYWPQAWYVMCAWYMSTCTCNMMHVHQCTYTPYTILHTCGLTSPGHNKDKTSHWCRLQERPQSY